MRPALIAIAIASLLSAGCTTAPIDAARTSAPNTDAPGNTVAAPATADAAFATLSKDWLEGMLTLSPISATSIGDHRHDGEMDDLSAEGRARSVDFSRTMLTRLDAIDAAALSRQNQIDALILRNQLRADIWGAQTLQSWAWDPQVYSGLAGSAIYSLMSREFAPLPERLKSATSRMEKLPRLYAQMRGNLDPARVPRIHAETVAKQNGGVLVLIDQFITPHADQLQGEDRRRLDAAIAGLRAAVAENQAWLDGTLVPNARGEFRLGAAMYDQKLQFSLNSALSRGEIKQRAQAELKRTRGEMYQIAQHVLKGRRGAPALPDKSGATQQQAAIEAALELAYAERPARDQVVPFAKQTLAEATDFVRQHDLVSVPDDPVKIILMPEFQRGVAVAYCDSPGPLDKGLDTYYAISPIPDEWTTQQTESFLREYNNRMIHLLSIHEAMPGHYLEGAHSAGFDSTLRAVMRSGLFAEGWAVYTEKVMADAGYLDHDPLFRLVQLKFYLRTIGNAILDQGVHVDGWSRAQAMDFMTRQTFQQEREAAGKWVRAQLTSAQLPTYFVGAQEHVDMRRAVEAREGNGFKLKAYHDRVLSYGAPPVRFVRQMLLDEPIR